MEPSLAAHRDLRGSPGADTDTAVAELVATGHRARATAAAGLLQQSLFEVAMGLLLLGINLALVATRRRARLVLAPDGLLAIRDLPPPQVRGLRLDRLVSVQERRWWPPLLRGEQHGWTWLAVDAPGLGGNGRMSCSPHSPSGWPASGAAVDEDAAARRPTP